MANVFGLPITDETLREMTKYIDRKITQTDRAHVALNMKNAEDKESHAIECVNQLKAVFGDGEATLCVIYNATGDTLTLVTKYDYHGHLGVSPYPAEIANGQWGAFLHVKDAVVPTGSAGAVVYRGRNQNGNVNDWMLGWSSPWNRITYASKAYAEIREADHYSGADAPWGVVFEKMEKSDLTFKDEWNNCVAMVTIGDSKSPIYEGIMTIKDA